MNLEFDFSKLTIGDLRVITPDASTGDLIAFANKVVVGGVYHLPATELRTIMELVMSEFAKWVAAPGEETGSLVEMLKDVRGL